MVLELTAKLAEKTTVDTPTLCSLCTTGNSATLSEVILPEEYKECSQQPVLGCWLFSVSGQISKP
ncbi:hypothetical protein [Brevibacillus choshinensis]|uniref:hypothetical protein n=1 Tax=Brevibacillus choshinensis TaxID=54911 RepID=UPI002E1E7F37|nr:hypothetical protein [Brevibacillus choshinensis]